METFKLLMIFLIFQALMSIPSIQGQNVTNFPEEIASGNSSLFRTYIGANFNGISFSDVPIHSEVEFHFILAFAIDYTNTSSPTPTNGNFSIFWDKDNLTPNEVIRIKNRHKNVKVALSIGGATVNSKKLYFQPTSVDSWVSNAFSSLTKIINDYNLDGIDIDYESFHAGPVIFAQCIGQLVTKLKATNVISMASIAPYDDHDVQKHYQALWKQCDYLFDYVNFQFYAYDKGTTVSQFLKHFDEQSENYNGGKVLASYATDGISGGLSPENGFFKACKKLKRRGKLAGIFVWSADDSKAAGFTHDKHSQVLLT